MFPALIAILEEVERIKQELNDLLPDIANAVGREVISYSKFSDKDVSILVIE